MNNELLEIHVTCFGVKEFFSRTLIPKMDLKIKLRIITKNHAAYSERGFLTKSISKPNGRVIAMPAVLKLSFSYVFVFR